MLNTTSGSGGGSGGGGGGGSGTGGGGANSGNVGRTGSSSNLISTGGERTAATGGSISNISNTSLTTNNSNSSRGNISQTGNQSIGASSQKSLVGGHLNQSSSSSSQQQNPNFDSNVISERVKNLATQIYQELKTIISRCNYDEDILSGLMPLIVRVLESLDLALIENQQLQVELELCKDDNEQLVIMFEKEKAAKRAIDKKLIESEYGYEEERQQYQQKIESLDNQLKMFELKAKNASDQASRFEEKEAERKREYNKLHDRYTELLRSHCDVVERVRHLVGNNEVANLSSINVPQHMVASSSDLTMSDLQTLNKLKLRHDEADFPSTAAATSRSKETLKSWTADTELALEDASLVVIDDMGVGGASSSGTSGHGKVGDGSSQNESDRGTGGVSETEGEHEKESENDSIAYTSMEKEFRKLIQENKDLLNTKNALNVVKDDLIAEVDRLTNEVSMYEQAVEQLNGTKDQMKQKVSALDAELRKTKEELDKAKQKIRENNEEGVPYSQRKRFGRAEMAKVLMERNNYKERFMELQDAVRYTELVRANRMETEKRSGLWKFFSNLFGAPPMPPNRAIMNSPRNSTSPVIAFTGGASSQALASADAATDNGGQVLAGDALAQSASAGSGALATAAIRSTSQRLSSNSDLIVLMDSDLNVDRSRTVRGLSGGGAADLTGGYIHAYGWSLRASSVAKSGGGSPDGSLIGSLTPKFSAILGGTSSHMTAAGIDPITGQPAGGLNDPSSVTFNHKLIGLQVPIPQYCRPLTGDSLGMKIWCATAIDQSGGDLAKVRHLAGEPVLEAASYHLNQANQSNASQVRFAHQDEQHNSADTSGSLVNISASNTPIKSDQNASSTASSPAASKQQQQQALRRLEQEVNQALNEDSEQPSPRRNVPILKTTTEMVLNARPFDDETTDQDLSTCVWICSAQHSRSKITIIDIKNKPNELLDSFYVSTFLYCIKSIGGCKPSDLLGIPGLTNEANQPADGPSDEHERQQSTQTNKSMVLNMIDELISTQKREFYKLIRPAKNNVGPAALRLETRATESGASGPTRPAGEEVEAAVKVNTEDDAEISRILDNDVSVGIATLQKINDFVAHTLDDDADPKASAAKTTTTASTTTTTTSSTAAAATNDAVYYQPISTHLPTVWMGGKDSTLYIHSAIGQWKDCIGCVQLADSILQMCHYRGRTFVALADGNLCVFFRNQLTKEWEFSQYLMIDVNLLAEATSETMADLHGGGSSSSSVRPEEVIRLPSDEGPGEWRVGQEGEQQTGADIASQMAEAELKSLQQQQQQQLRSSTPIKRAASGQQRGGQRRSKVAGIHCLELANKNLWLGYRNRVLIFDPVSLKLKHTFNVVPQVDNQIRQLVSMRDGVFVCLRSDLTLRLYSSLRPYQHIQNIDIEPVVTRLISPKTFVISHITAMRVVEQTLWIGIAHGIILTVPCKLVPQICESSQLLEGPDGARATGHPDEPAPETPTAAASTSHLSIARFVPKCDVNNAQISFHGHRDAVKFFVHAHRLMLSGGQGYLDFRLDMDDQSKAISDKSHLILWQLPS